MQTAIILNLYQDYNTLNTNYFNNLFHLQVKFQNLELLNSSNMNTNFLRQSIDPNNFSPSTSNFKEKSNTMIPLKKPKGFKFQEINGSLNDNVI